MSGMKSVRGLLTIRPVILVIGLNGDADRELHHYEALQDSLGDSVISGAWQPAVYR